MEDQSKASLIHGDIGIIDIKGERGKKNTKVEKSYDLGEEYKTTPIRLQLAKTLNLWKYRVEYERDTERCNERDCNSSTRLQFEFQK